MSVPAVRPRLSTPLLAVFLCLVWSTAFIFVDLALEDASAAQFAALRSLSPDAQIILMTAFGKPEVVRGALDLGAYRVISKPFEMQAIADLVAQAYGASGQRH